MTLRKFLALPLILSGALLAVFSEKILSSYKVLVATVEVSKPFILVVLCAVLLQLAGHWIRAYKTKYILQPVKETTTKFQFRALMLGYLGNTVFPLKLGELIRSYIMASADKVSWGLTLTLVLLERAVDALFLTIIMLLLIALNWVHFSHIASTLVALAMFALISIAAILAVIFEWPPVLRFIKYTSEMFNLRIKREVRFKVWSVIYGLQQVLRKGSMIRYIGLSCLSWLFYIASMAIVATQFSAISISFKELSLASVSPYYGAAIPSGPASLGSYSEQTNIISRSVPFKGDERISFDLTAWAIIVIPAAATGILLLFFKTKEPLLRRLPKASSSHALENKLLRVEDISEDMESFLDNYFSENSLSKIVHRLEREKGFRLVKYFKGGSDAITILALQDKKMIVKKIIPIDIAPRLKAQYDWLQKRHGSHGMVKALREQEEDDFYAIDLAYDENDIMYFDYMHHSTTRITN